MSEQGVFPMTENTKSNVPSDILEHEWWCRDCKRYHKNAEDCPRNRRQTKHTPDMFTVGEAEAIMKAWIAADVGTGIEQAVAATVLAELDHLRRVKEAARAVLAEETERMAAGDKWEPRGALSAWNALQAALNGDGS